MIRVTIFPLAILSLMLFAGTAGAQGYLSFWVHRGRCPTSTLRNMESGTTLRGMMSLRSTGKRN
jgi:hypothetical protein